MAGPWRPFRPRDRKRSSTGSTRCWRVSILRPSTTLRPFGRKSAPPPPRSCSSRCRARRRALSSTDYLKQVRALCDEAGLLLIFDEIQTGIGRTGTLFAYEHSGVRPDIMTLAKALANGLPMGAMLAREQVAAAFGPGSHASTFGGTPIVSAVALEVCRTMERDGILEHTREISDYFRSKLDSLKGRHAVIEEVRGVGLLLGIRLATDGELSCSSAWSRAF